jgi:hypothetical protein
MFDCGEGTEHQASALTLHLPSICKLFFIHPFPNCSKMQRACLQNPPVHCSRNIERVYRPETSPILVLCCCICRLISIVSASQVHHEHGGGPHIWTSCESCMHFRDVLLSFSLHATLTPPSRAFCAQSVSVYRGAANVELNRKEMNIWRSLVLSIWLLSFALL